MEPYNVMIIGSGPAGLFAAIWLERLGVDRIAIIDRKPYPAGGLLNDGKLNFDHRIGIDLNELQIDADAAESRIADLKGILTRFPQCRQVTYVDRRDRIDRLSNIAREQGAEFIAPEQWHWGTDHGRSAVDYLRGHLHKTDLFLNTEVTRIESSEDRKYLRVCRRDG